MHINEKQWHPNFLKYMEMIINNPNYKGLPINKKSNGSYNWVATAKSKIGQQRISWCISKAKELHFLDNAKIYPGMYADVMLAIHPTKKKVCQICGKEMSLYYHYPNTNFLNSLNKKFGTNFTECQHISDIWDELIKMGIPKFDIASFLIKKGNLSLSKYLSSKDEIIKQLEYACRKQNKKCLGPGAMSNFPDRYDGFHSYNRCCRSTQDKGRSKENLKSYTKDRRAYEYWSDGNIYAANNFMGSKYFNNISADHIGPISLGFVHDPRYLQPMPSSENSSKRDRLQIGDIIKIIEIEKRTKIYPMSWFSKIIWEFIKLNFIDNPEKVPTIYRDALKQNMTNFMFILRTILDNCVSNGRLFLIDTLLKPKYKYFSYNYEFNHLGEIISKKPRHYTDRSLLELERYQRIAIESVYSYTEKENRNNKPNLTTNELTMLNQLCLNIESDVYSEENKFLLINLIEDIEYRIIETL